MASGTSRSKEPTPKRRHLQSPERRIPKHSVQLNQQAINDLSAFLDQIVQCGVQLTNQSIDGIVIRVSLNFLHDLVNDLHHARHRISDLLVVSAWNGASEIAGCILEVDDEFVEQAFESDERVVAGCDLVTAGEGADFVDFLVLVLGAGSRKVGRRGGQGGVQGKGLTDFTRDGGDCGEEGVEEVDDGVRLGV